MIKESEFNLNLKKAIIGRGNWAYKTADRMQFGVPDIYATNGIWIESKVFSSKGVKSIDWLSKYSNQQIQVCKKLVEKGDFVLSAAYFDYPVQREKYVVIIPFAMLTKHPQWSIDDVRNYGNTFVNHRYDVEMFDIRYPRGLNTPWYNRMCELEF